MGARSATERYGEIRPIRHRLADRMRCHAFICMLGAHLAWHLRRA
jgi:hypothetical protein